MTKAMSLISPYCGAADSQYFYDNYVLTLMKRAVIYIVMSLCILGAKAQNLINADDKLVHFGFNVGINVMDFGIKSSMTPIDGKIYQSEVSSLTPGFSVGVIGDLRLHKFFNLRLIPSLHLGERTLTYMNDIDDELFKTTIKSTCITVPLYIKYSAVRIKNYRPYLLVGGGVNFDLAHDKTKPILLDYTDYFIEFGFGWTIYFEYFRLSPEIKFAIGFNNVHTSWEDRKHENGYLDPEHQKYNDALSRLTSRMFTLVFNFE